MNSEYFQEKKNRPIEVDIDRYYNIYLFGSQPEAPPGKATWEFTRTTGKVSENYYHPFSPILLEDENHYPTNDSNNTWGSENNTQDSYKRELLYFLLF
jgi:hypothetical protein